MRLAILLFIVFNACTALAQRLSTDELLGKIDAAQHPDFVKIDQKFTAKSNIYMRKEAYANFVRMADAAAKDGIQLQIISATRSFTYQKGIWERKWNQPKHGLARPRKSQRHSQIQRNAR
jgi:LAS superfamily LD-carboxypeptidase LdcB